MDPLIKINNFFLIGCSVVSVLLLAIAGYTIFLLKQMGALALKTKNKKIQALPKHQIDVTSVDPRWKEESAYESMLDQLHNELMLAIQKQDQETLETLSQGAALQLFHSRLKVMDVSTDRRQILQGSFRKSWDAHTLKLVVVLAVSRWNQGWRRYYEEWTLQRQGQAYFIVEVKPTRL